MAREFDRSRPRGVKSYRRLLVSVLDNPESKVAVDVACRLAADDGATISAVSVIEVPPLLPLDAHLGEEEARARMLLERVGATGESFGVRVVPRVLRAREAGAAIAAEARATGAELIVIGAARRTLRSTGAPVFGNTVQHVLGAARCRVLVVAAGPSREAGEDSRARIRSAAA